MPSLSIYNLRIQIIFSRNRIYLVLLPTKYRKDHPQRSYMMEKMEANYPQTSEIDQQRQALKAELRHLLSIHHQNPPIKQVQLLFLRLLDTYLASKNSWVASPLAKLAFSIANRFLSQKKARQVKHFLSIPQGEANASELHNGLKLLQEVLEQSPDISTEEGTVEESTPPSEPTELRAHFILLEEEKNRIFCIALDDSLFGFYLAYNLIGQNEAFNSSIRRLWQGAQLQLLGCEWKEGICHPAYIVVEPDLLMDVSSVADCFYNGGANPFLYLLRKFSLVNSNLAMLLGNVANYFLDEHVYKGSEQIHFLDKFKHTFFQYPLQYTKERDLIQPEKFKLYMRQAQWHFNNLDAILQSGQIPNVNVHDSFVEPSFLSPYYGIQGRLDLMVDEAEGEVNIIELKSSRSVPNSGAWISHQIQAYLYELLISKVFREKPIRASILYSAAERDHIRAIFHHPPYQKFATNIRNQQAITDYQLATSPSIAHTHRVISLLLDAKDDKFPSYLKQDLEEFRSSYYSASKLEQNYFLSFIKFVALEQHLARIGGLSDRPNGNRSQAGLWSRSSQEKKQSYDVLYDLRIEGELPQKGVRELTFRRPENSQNVSFRKGDIVILYPQEGEELTPLKNQLFKGNIAAIDGECVRIQLRFLQHKVNFFTRYERWAIEYDFNDKSFTYQFKNLYRFLSQEDKTRRELLLGVRQPQQAENSEAFFRADRTQEENEVLTKILQSKDYFLLQGPPGSGKTSRILRSLVEELYGHHKNHNILLLAYTNRAVDEICEAIREKTDFIRIGNSLSTGEEYRQYLFNEALKDCETRAEVRELITRTRIFVSTVSKMSATQELFELKEFHTVIIDEASQILEPNIIGILAQKKVGRFVLIGDQNQLPAVVVQDHSHSRVEDPLLHSVGLTDRRNSLFERLFSLCEKNNWHHAIGRLSRQGRMHEEIARFPREEFYNRHLLQVVEGEGPTRARQLAPILAKFPSFEPGLQASLAQSRLLFFFSQMEEHAGSMKIHLSEARAVKKIVDEIRRLEAKNHIKKPQSIGVITPFRDQVAEISALIPETNLPDGDPHKIIVDTVERYQGSQKDIIIISLSITSLSMLNILAKLRIEGGVDKKLNVSLTRAREQLILLGNPEILQKDPIYASLISHYKEFGHYGEMESWL